MGFRNDLDAAHLRAAALEKQVRALAASSAADAAALARARADLAAARKEIAALSVHLPGSGALRATPYRYVLFVGLGLVLATAVAGSQSESLGVSMSYFAGAVLGAGAAGWLGARRSRPLGIVLALAGALGMLGALLFFYEAVWPSL